MCRSGTLKGQNSVRDRVTEGQLGLVQLDSYEYVRAVGDADHESTFSFQTNPRVAQGWAVVL